MTWVMSIVVDRYSYSERQSFNMGHLLKVPEKGHRIWFYTLYAPDTNSWNGETDYNWHAQMV